MGSMLHISADLISGKEPTVPIDWMGWVGPRAGLTALNKIQIFLPRLLWNPKVSFHFRKSPLVPVLSQMSPVNNHPHDVLSTCFNYFKYNQQDAALYNILYYCQYSTCFGRFFRPSSGAQKLYTRHRVCAQLASCYR